MRVFSVNYNTNDASNFLEIHRYLMKGTRFKQYLDLLKIAYWIIKLLYSIKF